MLEQFDVLLFDADRTLFDTAAMETEALQKLMEPWGILSPKLCPNNITKSMKAYGDELKQGN